MDGLRVCDLCGGSDYELICRTDRSGRPLDTVLCSTCGLVGHRQLPNDQELTEFYAEHYRAEYHGETTPSPRRVCRAWAKGQRLVARLKPFLAPGATVFEVGAGLGCTVRGFELAGFQASGIEPGGSFQAFSEELLQARVTRGDLSEGLPTEAYALVLFVHVIEHLRSPKAALQAIHRSLREGGLLYLECPSLAMPYRRVSRHFHFAHLYTFSPYALHTLLRRCGFEIEKAFATGIGSGHRLLLRKVAPCEVPIAPEGVRQSRQFVQDFPDRWRRFRPNYWMRRVKKVSLAMHEYLLSGWTLRRILAQAQTAPRA